MEDKILGILDSIINNISDDIISKDEREKITINVNKNNSISLYGHFHIGFIKKLETNYYINPRSISLPKEEYKPSYLILEETKATIYDIEDKIIAKEVFK